MRIIKSCLLYLPFLLIAGGCIHLNTKTKLPPDGTPVFQMNELRCVEPIPLNLALAGAVDALKSLQFKVTWKESTALDALVEAEGVDDQKITIRLSSLAPKRTKIRIRVGLFGNKPHEKAILNALKKYAKPKPKRFFAN